jgi:hypothetical protein
MSVTRFEAPRHDRGRVLKGVLVAPLVPGAVVGLGFAVLGLPFAFPVTVFVGALFGWPAALVFGIPAHRLLQRWRMTSPLAYTAAGLLLGLAAMLTALLAGALAVALAGSPARDSLPVIAVGSGSTYFWAGLFGTIAGAAFWALVRPDRSQPEFPASLPEVFR